MVAKWLGRLFGGSNSSAYQDQVDTISQPTEAQRTREAERDSLFGGDQFTASAAEPEPIEHPPGLFGSIIAGIGAMKGLSQLAEQMQAGGSWFDQLNRISTELSEEARLSAVQGAITTLSPELQEELVQRIGAGIDPAEHVAETLAFSDGFQQLIARLLPAPTDPVSSTTNWEFNQESAAEAHPNPLQAMRDPLIRDFARTLIPALIQAKGEVSENESESGTEFSGFANHDHAD